MARAPFTPVDPAANAASLLRRVAFVTLMFLVPVTALVARRAVVVLVPIGIALIIIAAFLDGEHRPLLDAAKRIARAPAAQAAAVLLGWCVLSLAWAPFALPGVDRLSKIAATVALAIGGTLCLPDRMRSANLYLVPLGVGLAAILSIVLSVTGLADGPEDALEGQNLERGTVVLVLLLWPAMAWLRSRRRDAEALAVAVIVAVAAVLSPGPTPLIAIALGALVYALTEMNARLGIVTTAALTAGLLVLAPLLPFVARPFLGLMGSLGTEVTAGFDVWRSIVVADPARLITGHGFEAALRSRDAGLLPPDTPTSVLFELWYDLGVVGVVAAAAVVLFAVRGAARGHPLLLPGIMAAFATGFALASLGVGTAQMWWVTALVVVVLIFVATVRGQFRTSRPKISFFRAGESEAKPPA